MSANENRTNLIINYLPQTYSDEEMLTLFSTIGEVVNCKIIRDKNTGYSYGFGFVEYATPAEAQSAIQSLNGCEIENKRIKVALARPPGENTKGANLYVRNIPANYDENSLQELFARFGHVIQCRILLDHVTGQSKGTGFVLFDTKSNAEQALKEMNGNVPPGGTVAFNIKFADDNAKKVRAPGNERGFGTGFGPGAFVGPRPGGPMRGPSGGRMRYNPMSAGSGAMGNGYSGFSAGGYASGYGVQPKGRGMTNPVRGASVNQFGAGDASNGSVILFVYNIGVDATERDLWNLFCPYGTVQKVNVIWDHAQNKCKGYGFVTMSNMEEAKYAIEYLNGFYYKTAPLQVSIKSDKK